MVGQRDDHSFALKSIEANFLYNSYVYFMTYLHLYEHYGLPK